MGLDERRTEGLQEFAGAGGSDLGGDGRTLEGNTEGDTVGVSEGVSVGVSEGDIDATVSRGLALGAAEGVIDKESELGDVDGGKVDRKLVGVAVGLLDELLGRKTSIATLQVPTSAMLLGANSLASSAGDNGSIPMPLSLDAVE